MSTAPFRDELTSVRPLSSPLDNLGPQPTFSGLLQHFEAINLTQMDNVALQNRVDTKYVMNTRQLKTVLASLLEDYWVLDVDGVRLSPYQTLYFDTPDFALYLQHHAGKFSRYKVRSRRYVATDRSFLEVKVKTNKKRTIKRRCATRTLLRQFDPEDARSLDLSFLSHPQHLTPKLWNTFSRITLVSKWRKERLTLDLDLHFCLEGQCLPLEDIAIAEVKQDGINHNSDFMQKMRQLGIRPTGFSKYCIGVALLYPGLKHNRFKPKLRLLETLRGDGLYA